jgi:hypothetical protein
VKTLAVLVAFAACHRSVPVPPGTPRHGVVLSIGGLGSSGPVEIWYQFDLDTRVLMSYEGPYGVDKMAKATRHELSSSDANALWDRARAVLHAGGKPETSHVSDYSQRLVIADDGEAIDVSGDGPFLEARAKALHDELARLSR